MQRSPSESVYFQCSNFPVAISQQFPKWPTWKRKDVARCASLLCCCHRRCGVPVVAGHLRLDKARVHIGRCSCWTSSCPHTSSLPSPSVGLGLGWVRQNFSWIPGDVPHARRTYRLKRRCWFAHEVRRQESGLVESAGAWSHWRSHSHWWWGWPHCHRFSWCQHAWLLQILRQNRGSVQPASRKKFRKSFSFHPTRTHRGFHPKWEKSLACPIGR